MTRSSFSPLVTRRALFLLVLPLRAALGFPCGDVDCDEGFCIQQDIGGYQCICIDGYEGEHCNKIRRSTRGTKNDASCDAMPCQNGGTCIPTVDEMSGEAPMDMGESMVWRGAAIHVGVPQDSLVLGAQRQYVSVYWLKHML